MKKQKWATRLWAMISRVKVFDDPPKIMNAIDTLVAAGALPQCFEPYIEDAVMEHLKKGTENDDT